MNRYRPPKAAREEYATKMEAIRVFCADHGIARSLAGDSFYFELNGRRYRVSNHTIEQSNAGAYDWKGEQIREQYHENGRDPGTVYIHAGKMRIIEIYNDLAAGYELDGRGNRKGN